MSRPFLFCHMLTSIDGKIMGRFMDTPECESAGNLFDAISFGNRGNYSMQGWLSGRVTTDDNFTLYRKPELDPNAPPVPEGDFVTAVDRPMYYISIDPSGRLGWEGNTLEYAGCTATVIEVLTAKASNAYKAFLRKLEISYIIAGEDALDCALALEKLHRLFGFTSLMLGGGGVLNWTFIQQGLCDELSVVVAPVADGSPQTPSLFEMRGKLGCDAPVGFSLKGVEAAEDGSLWLRYAVKNSDGGFGASQGGQKPPTA